MYNECLEIYVNYFITGRVIVRDQGDWRENEMEHVNQSFPILIRVENVFFREEIIICRFGKSQWIEGTARSRKTEIFRNSCNESFNESALSSTYGRLHAASRRCDYACACCMWIFRPQWLSVISDYGNHTWGVLRRSQISEAREEKERPVCKPLHVLRYEFP